MGEPGERNQKDRECNIVHQRCQPRILHEERRKYIGNQRKQGMVDEALNRLFDNFDDIFSSSRFVAEQWCEPPSQR